MNSWAKTLNRRLKDYDSCLFVQEAREGRYDVYRRNRENLAMPHFLFSLTDSWQPKGTPVPYSADTIINRIKAHDLWRDDSFVERYIKESEVRKESKDRALRNSIESFLYDFRKPFAKATDGINTASLNKIYREKSHGHRQS